MKRTNPHGRTPLLGDGGKPAAEQVAPRVEPRQRCRDCVHWPRCSWLIGSLTGDETECDFDPNKFRRREEPPPIEPRQRSPKPWRSGVPLHHGKHSQAQGEAWDAEGLWRREGHDPVPSWQRTMRAGCCRCMARPGILPADHERARGMMLERGWRWGGGMWLCDRCVSEEEQR